MTAPETGLDGLRRQHPEWAPWLALVQTILFETADPKWDALVPLCAPARDKMPLLANARLDLRGNAVGSLWEKLVASARRNGTPQMASLKAAVLDPPHVSTLFTAALNYDADCMNTVAVARHVDGGAFQAVALLMPVPFLHACNRRWARSVAAGWSEGYCPVCGAWPAFAEVRGIERSRYLRCGRCGGEWQARGLYCFFCGMSDHKELVSLVPEKSGSNSLVEACSRCHGYVKSFMTLQGSPPDKVMLEDLASVELDIAAVEQGYKRPEGAGYRLHIAAESSGFDDVLA